MNHKVAVQNSTFTPLTPEGEYQRTLLLIKTLCQFAVLETSPAADMKSLPKSLLTLISDMERNLRVIGGTARPLEDTVLLEKKRMYKTMAKRLKREVEVLKEGGGSSKCLKC